MCDLKIYGVKKHTFILIRILFLSTNFTHLYKLNFREEYRKWVNMMPKWILR